MKFFRIILMAALLPLAASAERIREIRIVNEEGVSYDISSVAAFTSFEVGEEVTDTGYIMSAIAVDVDRMRASGRYSYVDARMELEPEGVVLIYTVVSKNKLRRIEISGAKHMRSSKVRNKTELTIGQFADEADFAQAAARIREAYRGAWYPDAEVEWTTVRNEELGTVDVAFQINEGRRLAVRKIVFEGNDSMDDKTLRKVMQQKEKWLLSFLTGAGKYKPEIVDMDVFALRSFYMNQGFLDVQVDDPRLDDARPERTRLIFTIREGQQYRVGSVSLSGMQTFEEQELRRGIRLAPGDVAAYEAVEAGRENIRAYYGNRGYIRTVVTPVFDADAARGTVDIRYEISEGPIGYIDKINITGNERTRDKVIRRELVIHPGDRYNRSLVRSSENRVRNLNYFETVTASTEPAVAGDKYDLNIQVSEKPTGSFMAGIGFSTVDSLVGYVELKQGNFSLTDWPPMGAGQKFKIRVTAGTERNDIDVSFVEPWFLDRQLSFGVDLFHHEWRYFSDAYDQKNDGMRLSLGKSLGRFTRGTLAYTIEQFDVFDVQDSASDAIKAEEGKRLKSGLDFTLARDTRDRPFNPTRGNSTSLTPYFAGGPIGAETDIFGAKLRSAQYWPLIGGLIFNVRGQMETVDCFGDSSQVPIFDRLFLGGSYTLRGFEYRDVGPRDINGEPVGGSSSAYLTAELTYPIFRQIRGAVFYDSGFVNLDPMDFDPSAYNDDWGIGLRLDIPGFPLHLDYAWPITYDSDWQTDKGRFNFLIGHTF